MSASPNLYSNFEERNVSLEQLLFDPNNPRLFGIVRPTGGFRNLVPLEQIIDSRVQDAAYRDILSFFDPSSIKDSISQVGYVPIDRIVVRPYPGVENRWIVIEGNRRLAAMKLITEESVRGEEVRPGLIEQFNTIPVVVYLGSPSDFERHRFTLQGIRHIAGIRAWGPYERGLAIMALTEAGKTPHEISEILFLKVSVINKTLRTMNALNQMKNDDEYGEHATPEHYTHMEELISKRKIKEELEWRETSDSMYFENEDRFREVISWMVDDEDKKIFQSIQIRMLPKIFENPDALEFLRRPGVNIEEAHAYTIRAPPTITLSDARRRLNELISILESLSAEFLRSPQDTEILSRIQTLVRRRLQDAESLQQIDNPTS